MKTTRYSVVAGLVLAVAVSCGGPPKPAQTEPESMGSEPETPVPGVATPAVAVTRAMYVNVDVANVRRDPSKVAEVLGKMRLGEEVVAVGMPELEWQKIVYDEAGVEAWVYSSLLSATLEEAMTTREASKAAAPADTAVSAPTEPTDVAPPAEAPVMETTPPVASTPAAPDERIRVGTPADTVLAMRGAADGEQIVGSDANGSIVEWKYADVTYVMKRWAENGVECYRVAEIR